MSLPPGPSISATVGSLRLIKRPYQLLMDCYRKYGDIFTVKLLRLGPTVFLADPDAIKEVFTHQAKKFNAGETSAFLSPFVGEHSLLLIDGQEHARHRKLLAPAFHGERMKMFGDVMRDSAYDMVDRWRVGEVVMIRQEMQAITLRVIVESIFGREVSSVRTPEIIEIVRHFLQIPTLLTFLPFLRVNLGPWSPWGRFLKWRDKLDRIIYSEIERRQANPHAEPKDVLDMLLMSRDEEGHPMTRQEIRDECLTLLLAGHETTALSLTWFFVSLLHAPQVLEKLQEELATVVGNGQVSVEMLPRLNYLDACIKESMRINNLFPIVGRKVIEPVEIKGYLLPVGTVLTPCNLIVHQLPHLYPQPDEFRPERFLGETHPFGWFPFGGGPRRCIGMNFALFEMKMLLSSIIPRVKLELLPGQNFNPERIGLALSPPTGVNVRVLSVKESPKVAPQYV